MSNQTNVTCAACDSKDMDRALGAIAPLNTDRSMYIVYAGRKILEVCDTMHAARGLARFHKATVRHTMTDAILADFAVAPVAYASVEAALAADSDLY